MIRTVKRVLIYFSGAVALMAAINASSGVLFPWPVTLGACGVLLLCAVLFAFLEEHRKILPWGSSGSTAEGSILISISEGLDSVRCARPDEEDIALEANKLVKEALDKRAIDYESYRNWRKKNPNIFTALVTSTNILVGFFDIFPLKDMTAEKMIEGCFPEKALTIEDILTPSEAKSCNYLYIATIMANPHQEFFSEAVARDITLLKFEEFVSEVYVPAEQRSYIAYAYTKEGEALLKRCGFALVSLPQNNPQGAPLFLLKAGQLGNVREKFGGLRKRLSKSKVMPNGKSG